jgi:hypothetical protein
LLVAGQMQNKICAVFLFFLIYLFIGVAIYKDYGISYDELDQRKTGAVAAAYINKIFKIASVQNIKDHNGKTIEIPNLKDWEDRDYGVLFELVLIVPEFVLKLKDSKIIFEIRHLLTFLTFWVGVIFFYFLIQEVFKDWKFGLAGCLFLVFSPRIFADSFYNSKDTILLSFVILASFTLIRFLREPSLLNSVVHALTSSAVIGIRIVGVYLVALAILFIVLAIIKSESPRRAMAVWLKPFLAYLLGVLGFAYLIWPFLWENPIHNFLLAFHNMSKFRWHGDVLYLGEFIKASELPWHYVPVWILISTPLVYSFLFLVGSGATVCQIARHPLQIYRNEESRNQLLFLSLFLTPLMAVILLHSILYDAWRQMFFIYPFYLLMALFGVNFCIQLWQRSLRTKYVRPMLVLLFIAGLINLFSTGFFMIKNHPYQNVYFNALAGSDVAKNFELDYWGLTYRKALEFISSYDPSDPLYIHAADFPGEHNQRILDEKDRRRIKFVPLDEATYFISNYRYKTEYEKYRQKAFPYCNELYSIAVNNIKIVGIYRLHRHAWLKHGL